MLLHLSPKCTANTVASMNISFSLYSRFLQFICGNLLFVDCIDLDLVIRFLFFLFSSSVLVESRYHEAIALSENFLEKSITQSTRVLPQIQTLKDNKRLSLDREVFRVNGILGLFFYPKAKHLLHTQTWWRYKKSKGYVVHKFS